MKTMDLLNYQYLDKMNNNITILCYEGVGEATLRAEGRMQTMPVTSPLSNHRTGPPPISPTKRKYSSEEPEPYPTTDSQHSNKASRGFIIPVSKPANGDYRKDQHRERSRSPIERPVGAMNHHSGHGYTGLGLPLDQPLALTKNSISVDRQQNRPSVITCASANNRNCNLSHCPIAHLPLSYRRTSNPSLASPTACDPVVEEHFRRSLGEKYKQPEPAANSVSITGSVDDHFAKALGEKWLQIKAAKDGVCVGGEGVPRRGQSPPASHMVTHNHSPSVVS